MPVSDWLDLMPHTVTYEAVTARDEYGKPSAYATAVSYRARVTNTRKRVPGQNGVQDLISSCQVWINGVISGLGYDDRITLPNGSRPLIASWDTPTDEVGYHHMKIYLV